MNHAHKSIWNESLGTYVAASETVASGGARTSSSRKARRHLGRSPTQRLALEPRIVFDGAMAVEGLSAVERQFLGSAVAPVERTVPIENQPVLPQALAANQARPQAVVNEGLLTESRVTDERWSIEAASAAITAPQTTEIVFVSASVSDVQAFLTSRPGTEVIVLDANRDGMAQIAAALSGRSGISAIHILSHGQAGQITLGTTTLSISSITGAHADELATIKASLTGNADILIYGCDAGAGAVGQNFINALADATGADIAASTDKTGAAARGGDWVLEASTGRIETDVVLDIRGQAEYQGLMAPFSINAATGALTEVGTEVLAGNAPLSIAILGVLQ